MALGEITCMPYSTLRSGEGFRGRHFPLAQSEMLVMLYLRGEGTRCGVQYVTECPWSSQWGVVVTCSRAGTEMGREGLHSCQSQVSEIPGV